jgi:hypothetical protein
MTAKSIQYPGGFRALPSTQNPWALPQVWREARRLSSKFGRATVSLAFQRGDRIVRYTKGKRTQDRRHYLP